VDVRGFLEGLPGLYDGWGRPSARPRDGRFAALLGRVRGMTAPGVLQLLNAAAGRLGEGEAYVEVGCFRGATLAGALLGHPAVPAHAADDFSEFDPHGRNADALRSNLEVLGLARQVRFRRADFEAFLPALAREGVRAGVYLYDGAHDYRSQLLGLLLAAPLLAPRALVVLDDANEPAVRQAAWDFMAVRRECRLLLDLPTPGNGDPSFWNGLYVLGWEAGSDNGHGPDDFRRARQPGLLRALYGLQTAGPGA
jgi:hypothetical protein